MDLEMTGLNPEHDRIIEMATIITDRELKVVAEGPVIVIHQEQELLDGMDEWNTRTHGKTGLTDAVKRSRITENFSKRSTHKAIDDIRESIEELRFYRQYMFEEQDF